MNPTFRNSGFWPSPLPRALPITTLNSAVYDTPAYTFLRTSPASVAAPLITALFRNTGEVAGGSDYQNEVHIRLQAGTSTDHRRYLNFAGYDGVDDWLTGANASNVWILFDANTPVHRLWFENSVNAGANSGHTYINSAGTGAIIFNGLVDGTGNEGTGGVYFRSGGSSPQTVYYIDNTGHFVAGGTTPSANYTGFITGTYANESGASVGGLFVQTTHNPANPTTATMYGALINPKTGGSQSFTALCGISATATHSAAAAIATLTGGIYIAQNLVGQTVSNAYGGQFQVQNSNASGVITTGYGVYVLTPTNSGTLTNYHGIRVLDATATTSTTGIRSGITSGTGKWNLYIDGTANNHIAAKISLGQTNSPTAFLDIAAGTAAQAQARLRSSVDPTSPNDGELWYNGRILFRRSTTTETIASGVTGTGGAATASASYTATEQTMLQKVYDAARNFGLLN